MIATILHLGCAQSLANRLLTQSDTLTIIAMCAFTIRAIAHGMNTSQAARHE
ncbi:MAG: hypothetical protein QF483_08295 [Gammaproteobacteria bacterium]|nr:hypothetical protein [Gammaproteobacteria bacterium]MDP7419869.1 hypothetical protein [Gammaproteobacteria bacterium]MDP7660281.1 hypothetical protein [Gammaproteobacteria bacterium]